MPVPLPNADHDQNFELDFRYNLQYRYPKRKGPAKGYSFPPRLQGFVYHVYMETEDPEEVRERLLETMGLAKNKISVPVVSALIRRVVTEIRDLESNNEYERGHWIFVRSPQVPSAEDSARAVAALFRRVTFEKQGDEFIVRCRSLVFKLAHQAFIYTATKYLTSKGTAMALARWAPEMTLKSTNDLHVRRVYRCIEHQRLATSDADETDHWNTVLRRADRMLKAVRQYAPAEEILQGVSEHFLALEPSQSDPAAIPLEESHRYRRGHGVEQVMDLQRTVIDPYPGQQLPTATAGRIYPQSPFVNAPQPLTSGQPTYPPNQYPGLPQPAAQPEYSYAPNPDPRLSRTTTQKRRAQHTLESGSSNSRPSTSGSNSSGDHGSQGGDRHGSAVKGSGPSKQNPRSQSSEEEEKEKNKVLKERTAIYKGLEKLAFDSGFNRGGTPDGLEMVSQNNQLLERDIAVTNQVYDMKRDTRRWKKEVQRQTDEQSSASRGGQRVHHSTGSSRRVDQGSGHREEGGGTRRQRRRQDESGDPRDELNLAQQLFSQQEIVDQATKHSSGRGDRHAGR